MPYKPIETVYDQMREVMAEQWQEAADGKPYSLAMFGTPQYDPKEPESPEEERAVGEGDTPPDNALPQPPEPVALAVPTVPLPEQAEEPEPPAEPLPEDVPLPEPPETAGPVSAWELPPPELPEPTAYAPPPPPEMAGPVSVEELPPPQAPEPTAYEQPPPPESPQPPESVVPTPPDVSFTEPVDESVDAPVEPLPESVAVPVADQIPLPPETPRPQPPELTREYDDPEPPQPVDVSPWSKFRMNEPEPFNTEFDDALLRIGHAPINDPPRYVYGTTATDSHYQPSGSEIL